MKLPSANVTIAALAAILVGGVDTVCVIAPVATSADAVPRLFGSASAVIEQHGYGEGPEYVALHASATRKPVVFVGIPIATAGAVGREDTSGNTGTCVTTLAAGSSGVLHEHEGSLAVESGGTIGTDQIVLTLSLDDGVTTRRIRLGTASTLTIPDVGVTVSFAAGTLVAGDTIHTWFGTGPRGDATGWAAARAALAGQQKFFRSGLLIGDLQNGTEAASLLSEINAYKSENQRATMFRASVYDRLPLAVTSATTVAMTGAPSITFAEVGATGDTITRSAGSFVSDGFAAGDIITIAGSSSNDLTTAAAIASVTALVITLDTDDLADEGPVTGVSITGEGSFTFSDSADTIVRTRGSWLADGFRVGDSVTVADTSSNDGTYTVTAVTATTLTLEVGDLADEVAPMTTPTVSAGQTKAAWMAEITTAFEAIDDAPRLSLGAGRARVYSPLTQWWYRRPVSWRDSVRSYQHDVHITTWRKSDGPTGDNLFDANGTLVEWDDRVDGEAASAARFTSYRTWSNGPVGAFIAVGATRAKDGTVLVLTHNQAVTDLAVNTCQLATEELVGRTEIKDADGHLVEDALVTIESEVNQALESALLQDLKKEGPRASSVSWVASRDDDFSVAEPTLTGVLELNLNGTIFTVETSVRVQ